MSSYKIVAQPLRAMLNIRTEKAPQSIHFTHHVLVDWDIAGLLRARKKRNDVFGGKLALGVYPGA